MAKDGTARGGQRVGQGRRSKALAEKLAAGNPGHRPMLVMDLPEGTQLDGEEMSVPGEYLKARQRNGGMLEAEKYIERRGYGSRNVDARGSSASSCSSNML